MTVVATNPSTPQPTRVTEATRVPMDIPAQKLAVPDIPGWYLYWFRTDSVARALKAGYQFIDPEEVEINNSSVADSLENTGSTDMGTRVSISAGQSSFDARGVGERLYLMKLPMEWHLKDMESRDTMNERTARQLRGGVVGADDDPEKAKRYMKAGQDLFFRKTRKV
jgi:hypothetical protein